MIVLIDVGELVGHNFHDALARGGKPQIPFVVRHDVGDGVVHGQVFQLMKTAAVDHPDTVSRADPDVAVEIL